MLASLSDFVSISYMLLLLRIFDATLWQDIDCMPLNPLENLPAALLGKQPFDKFHENFNELKINGQVQECMKLCPGVKVETTDDISQLSPSANPASLLKQIKA